MSAVSSEGLGNSVCRRIIHHGSEQIGGKHDQIRHTSLLPAVL
jgi:hypothetical protein